MALASTTETARPRKDVAFSTRFLPSDGIPAYNALLDTRLGKRREFLLGNKRSLQHLQRTGAIARVEENAANPSQYVVVMNEPNGKPPSLATTLRRAPTLSHEHFGRPAFTRSESTPQLSLGWRRQASGPPEETEETHASSGNDGEKRTRAASVRRSTSEATLPSATAPSPTAVIDRLRRRRHPLPAMGDDPPLASRVTFAKPKPSLATAEQERSAVERLLASDAAFQLKLQVLQDEMAVLEREKQFFASQIAALRKKLRGVHAVRENDAAVAHCAAIMHARISKAEEEFMKLVTAQQQVKTDIDTLRRELLAMRKVAKKLVDDIAAVETANAALGDKVRAAKSVRNALSQELVELERRAELEAEEQRLALPPEQDVVVDAREFMSAVQQRHGAAGPRDGARRSTVVLTAGSPLEILQRMLGDKAATPQTLASEKPLLSFRRAFRVIEQKLGADTSRQEGEEDDGLARFVAQFEETEDALLSKHKLNSQLQDEVDALENEAAKLAQEAAQRSAAVQLELQERIRHALERIRHALERIESYNALREMRNHQQTRLRAIMQRCLEILHAEKLVNSQESLGGPLLLSELSSPAMLEALQKKMTEVAITLKLQHHVKASEDEAPPRDRRAKQSVATTRRSNLLLKRDACLSKIVLGPREPSGAALTAILITAQPPTVEGAQALSETHAAGMHALHPSVVSAEAAPPRSTRRLTITRTSSIRAGKRMSALVSSGSSRRISEPVPSAATTTPAQTKPTRASMIWPVRSNSSLGGSSDCLIRAEDAHARVVENTDELDATA